MAEQLTIPEFQELFSSMDFPERDEFIDRVIAQFKIENSLLDDKWEQIPQSEDFSISRERKRKYADQIFHFTILRAFSEFYLDPIQCAIQSYRVLEKNGVKSVLLTDDYGRGSDNEISEADIEHLKSQFNQMLSIFERIGKLLFEKTFQIQDFVALPENR